MTTEHETYRIRSYRYPNTTVVWLERYDGTTVFRAEVNREEDTDREPGTDFETDLAGMLRKAIEQAAKRVLE